MGAELDCGIGENWGGCGDEDTGGGAFFNGSGKLGGVLGSFGGTFFNGGVNVGNLNPGRGIPSSGVGCLKGGGIPKPFFNPGGTKEGLGGVFAPKRVSECSIMYATTLVTI